MAPVTNATATILAAWAERLGVSDETLQCLGCTLDGAGNLRWPERDADGAIIGYSTRFDDGSKKADAGGKRGLCYCSPLHPYAGTSPDQPIILVEGLSDTAAATELGFDAIGRPSATGGNALLAPLVKDRHICIMGENDSGAGKTGAEKCASDLHGHAASVKVIFPPAEQKDLRAWVAAAGLDVVRGQLATAIDDAPLWTPPEQPGVRMNGKARAPVIRRLADVAPEAIEWLWPGVIVTRGITGIVGEPGEGKSLFSVDLSARVSTGAGWPDAPGRYFAPRGVLLITAEDALASVVRPRLDAAGADCSRINALDAVKVRGEDGKPVEMAFDLTDIDVIEAAADRTDDLGLIIIDPWTAFLGKAKSNDVGDTRALMRPLHRLAEQRNISIVIVSHLRKGEGRALHRAVGSIGFVAAARLAWGITRDREHPDVFRRLMLPLKSNYSPDSRGFAYRIAPPVNGQHPSLEWEVDRIDVPADDLMSGGAAKPGPDPDEQDRACEWLRQALSTGPRKGAEVVEEARECESISKRTLERAKKTLGIVAYRPENPGPWWWRSA